MILHLNESGLPFTSVDPEPSSCTTAPTPTTWLGPGFATGGVLNVEIVTVEGLLFNVPSLTTSSMMYAPARSGMKPGVTDVGLFSDAVLPMGLLMIDHAYVSGSPSVSDE